MCYYVVLPFCAKTRSSHLSWTQLFYGTKSKMAAIFNMYCIICIDNIFITDKPPAQHVHHGPHTQRHLVSTFNLLQKPQQIK